MKPADLLTIVRARPFQPFRMHLSDGTVYEVRHPELVVVALGTALVGYPAASVPGAWESYDIVALSHIVRVDFIQQPGGAPQAEPAPGA
jgi:hypothetical protein